VRCGELKVDTLRIIGVSVAMIGPGYSLWRTTRTEHNDATIGGHDPRGVTAVAE
jgi:hypothetical protein